LRKSTRKYGLIGFAAIAVAAIQISSAVAADWPERIVKIIVPYGPGGGVDSFARPIASVLSEQLSNRLIIQNRAGAGGTVAVLAAARSAADGYVLLAGGVHQPMAEAIYPSRGYRIDKDFVPIAITAEVPNVLVVPEQSLASKRFQISSRKPRPTRVS
jgi:tripartite-type tricarboxylate transporter receptor subunit TctC